MYLTLKVMKELTESDQLTGSIACDTRDILLKKKKKQAYVQCNFVVRTEHVDGQTPSVAPFTNMDK